MSATAGSSSYSTSISDSASSAASMVSAATAAILSPMKRTLSRASTDRSRRLTPTCTSGTSAPVSTAWTPGTWRARVASTRTNVACANVLRRHFPHSASGTCTSAVYSILPETLSGPSTRPIGCPTTLRSMVAPVDWFDHGVSCSQRPEVWLIGAKRATRSR